MFFVPYILVAFALIGYFIDKKIFNPITLFCGFWAFISQLAVSGQYGMIEVSRLVWQMILLGNASFFIACLVSRIFLDGMKLKFRNLEKIKKARGIQSFEETETGGELNKTFIYGMLFITMTFSLWLSMKVIELMSKGISYGNIRNYYYGYGDTPPLIESNILGRVNNWIVIPSIYLLIMVLVFTLIQRKGDKRLISLIVLDIFLFVFSSGGRFPLLFLAAEICTMISWKGILLSKKIRRVILFFMAILIIGIFAVTKVRLSSSSSDLGFSIYSYFSIPVPLLSYWTNQISLQEVQTYGGMTFYGFFSFIQVFLNRLGMPLEFISNSAVWVNAVQEDWIIIFNQPAKSYNAFVSVFFYFYSDFRMLGVVLGCFVSGVFCYLSYFKAFVKRGYKDILLFLLLVQGVITSMVRWPLAGVSFVIALIFYRFILKYDSSMIGNTQLRKVRIYFGARRK